MPDSSRDHARITVVNHSSDFIDLMHEFLGRELGHEVTGFEAIHTSLDDLVDSRPDLLIVDFQPENRVQEVSGWELLLLARSHPDLRHVPVIIASADTGGLLAKHADDLASMADVHTIVKPFSLGDLETAVQTLLASGRRPHVAA